MSSSQKLLMISLLLISSLPNESGGQWIGGRELTPQEVAESCSRVLHNRSFECARRALSDLHEEYPDNIFPSFAMATLLHTNGNLSEACEWYSKGLQHNPSHVRMLWARATCYTQLGLFAQAHDDYLILSNSNDNLTFVHNSAAWHFATCPEAQFRNGPSGREVWRSSGAEIKTSLNILGYFGCRLRM